MSTATTKGNWHVTFPDDEGIPFIVDASNNTVALFKHTNCADGSLLYGRSLEETIANAKIIATAPDMLGVLLKMQPQLERLGRFDLIEEVQSIITKATI